MSTQKYCTYYRYTAAIDTSIVPQGTSSSVVGMIVYDGVTNTGYLVDAGSGNTVFAISNGYNEDNGLNHGRVFVPKGIQVSDGMVVGTNVGAYDSAVVFYRKGYGGVSTFNLAASGWVVESKPTYLYGYNISGADGTVTFRDGGAAGTVAFIDSTPTSGLYKSTTFQNPVVFPNGLYLELSDITATGAQVYYSLV